MLRKGAVSRYTIHWLCLAALVSCPCPPLEQLKEVTIQKGYPVTQQTHWQVLRGPQWSKPPGRATLRKQMNAFLYCPLSLSSCGVLAIFSLRQPPLQASDLPSHKPVCFYCPARHTYDHCTTCSWRSHCHASPSAALAECFLQTTLASSHQEMCSSLPQAGMLCIGAAAASASLSLPS